MKKMNVMVSEMEKAQTDMNNTERIVDVLVSNMEKAKKELEELEAKIFHVVAPIVKIYLGKAAKLTQVERKGTCLVISYEHENSWDEISIEMEILNCPDPIKEARKNMQFLHDQAREKKRKQLTTALHKIQKELKELDA